MQPAQQAGRAIVWGLGAHVIKTGLSPVLDRPDGARLRLGDRDQRRRDHSRLRAGALGRARPRTSTKRSVPAASAWRRKPATLLNAAINDGVARGLGIGQAVGAALPRDAPRRTSAQHRRRGRAPRDSGHGPRRDRHRHHPHAPGRLRRGARRRAACATSATSCRTSRASNGGVYLNCGSAVVLPEVFLKAVALARNRGVSLDGLTTVNLDFARLYRPQTNVVSRPVAGNRHGLLAGRAITRS